MAPTIDRRAFLALGAAGLPIAARRVRGDDDEMGEGGGRRSRIKLSCNFYSFNEPLSAGDMTLEQAIDFCAEIGFDAVDLTGYYFPGYPDAPAPAYVHETKRRTFRLALDISGTGVRNDFTQADRSRRAADVAHVKSWIEVAARLDAPVIRVFARRGVPEGHTRDEVMGWVVECLGECTTHGERHGVMVVLQNHDELLKTAEEVLEIRRRVSSAWFGLNVDIGSLRTGDPYEEIARLAPHAYTWQIKEHVYRRGVEEKTDLLRVFTILREAGYRGYAPLEVLGPGDPRPRLRRFLEDARAALA
jgi:sugar phosphate isomerase/epimerase